ncbi:MAG TPA: hypothetical protein VHL54_13935 [Actinomycetota bacterium]|nr:hypothetical protein [Actinomycetota bacterium]
MNKKRRRPRIASAGAAVSLGGLGGQLGAARGSDDPLDIDSHALVPWTAALAILLSGLQACS